MTSPDRLPQTSPLSEKVAAVFTSEYYGKRVPIMDESGIPDWLVIGEDKGRLSRVRSSCVAFIPLHLSSEYRSVQTKGLNPDLLHAMIFVRHFDSSVLINHLVAMQQEGHERPMEEAMNLADWGVIAVHGSLYPADLDKAPEDLLHEIGKLSKTTNDYRTPSLEFSYVLQTGAWPFSPYTIEMQVGMRRSYTLSDPFPIMPEEAFPARALQVDVRPTHSVFPQK